MKANTQQIVIMDVQEHVIKVVMVPVIKVVRGLAMIHVKEHAMAIVKVLVNHGNNLIRLQL